jgi:hypothetical protein
LEASTPVATLANGHPRTADADAKSTHVRRPLFATKERPDRDSQEGLFDVVESGTQGDESTIERSFQAWYLCCECAACFRFDAL